MSTFTTIRTAIRNTEAMRRVLRAIPGAKVEENVMLRVKETILRAIQVPFSVTLGNDANITLFAGFRKAMRGESIDIRHFYVERAEDGTYVIRIREDQDAYRAIDADVKGALRSSGALVGGSSGLVSGKKISGGLPASDGAGRYDSGGQKRTEAQRPAERGAKEERDRLERERRRAEADQVQAEAAAALTRMDAVRATASSMPTVQAAMQENMAAALNQVLGQQYAKERVLEQLDDIQRQHGVSLGGIETLEDGTIEIVLRG